MGDRAEGPADRQHRVAVIVNGWSSEFLRAAFEGVREEAEKDGTDLFVFVTFNLSGTAADKSRSQLQVFSLIDPSFYDGAIIFSNTMNTPEERQAAQKKFEGLGKPVISTEVRLPGAALVGTGNYKGVYDLACHLIEKHGARKIVFVSGYEGNEESNIRKKALIDALEAHGLELEDVMSGDFGFYRTSQEAVKWMEEGKPIPDAFVCANDHMALAIVSTFRQYGYEVPRDFLVTGYDQINEGQVSHPIIATVSRPWKDMGARAYRELVRQMGDPDPDYESIAESCFVPSESCGCEADEAAKSFRLKIMQNHYAESSEINMVDFFFQEMRIAMAQIESKEHFHEIADSTLGKRHFFGNDYCICIDPRFFETDDDSCLQNANCFSGIMDDLYERKDGSTAPQKQYPIGEVYPGYRQEPGKSNIYTFSSLNNTNLLIGYLALKNNPEIMYDLRFKRWINNMETLLITIRQYMLARRANRKLRAIYMTDVLTGVYNRTGCENILFSYIREEKAAGRGVLLLFADIDRMKDINDGYGHLNGDLAIRATAQALKESLPDGWLLGRYGGDEFIAVGPLEEGHAIEQYRHRFSEELADIVAGLKVSFRLEASLGACVISPDDDGEIEDYISRADASMYIEKQMAHVRFF